MNKVKTDQQTIAIAIIGILDCIIGYFVFSETLFNDKMAKVENYTGIEQITLSTSANEKKEDITIDTVIKQITNPIKEELNTKAKEEEERLRQEQLKIEEEKRKAEEAKKIVFDNMTLDQLAAKLEKSLNSTLSGKGYMFAKKSIELGLDPYLALAIVLEETGCKWDCSALVKQCNNIGGQKGAPGCWGGEYRSYPTLDDGIYGYLDNLYYNYYAKGLTTPETINPYYAESPAWASHINSYISYIKAN